MAHAAQAPHDHHDHGHGGGGGHHHHIHPPSHYVKIYFVLLALFIVSVMGPMLGHKMLTIFTAFGIAIVKALLVAAFFMHLNIEKRYIWYLLYSMLLFVALFFWGVAADINRPTGRNWIKKSALTLMEEHKNAAPAHGEGAEHHEE
jgi:caa(3)-type oxidase subunit IV